MNKVMRTRSPNREAWLPIKNYEGQYEISNLGRVRNLHYRCNTKDKGVRELKPRIATNGYYCVHLYKDGKRKLHTIHRLMAMAFIPNPNGYSEVNHIDENKLNNSLDNLEWVTHGYNIAHSHNIEKAYTKISKAVLVYNKKTKEFIGEYKSTREAARELNCYARSISNCLKGVLKTHKGYIFTLKK